MVLHVVAASSSEAQRRVEAHAKRVQRLAKLAEQHNAHIVMFNAYKEEFQESPEMKGLLVRCQDLIKEKQIEEAQEELTFEQVLADERSHSNVHHQETHRNGTTSGTRTE